VKLLAVFFTTEYYLVNEEETNPIVCSFINTRATMIGVTGFTYRIQQTKAT